MRVSWLRLLVAVSLGTMVFVVGPTGPTFASSVPPVSDGVADGGGGLYSQVQIPIPNFDFNPTKWVQDAFAALLQSFSDGIQAGMNALWDANFIAQTPPILTYQNEDIRGLYGTMRGAANAALADQGSRPNGQPTPSASVLVPFPTAEPSMNVGLSARVVQLAEAWLGVPYQFGRCSRAGVGCSCLIENVYGAVGIHLPRIAVDQFNATVPISDPQPGDLVFFADTYEPGISHVGIYLGGGLQINAPTTGQLVSVAPVFSGYWGNHYAGAHRVRS